MQTAALTSESLPLRGVLDEFRTALREEILAAQRSSSSNAVQLKNGRRIGGADASFQYAFAVDSILNAPGDAPGHLIVPEKGRVPTTMISTEGLTITISVGIDLGSFVPSARLEIDLTFLLGKLIERVEALNGKSNCAGDRILGFAAVSGAPELLSVKGFNPEQNDAIASSLGRDTTFIWGPPGTGKTTTIGAIAAELFERHRSVLLVSHTNTAVDEALLRIAERLGDETKDGSVLRVGVPKDNKGFEAKPELLLATNVEKRSAELTARGSTLEQERIEKTGESLNVQRLIAIYEWATEAASDLDRASINLDSVQSLEAGARESRAAFENLRKDESRWGEIANEAVLVKQLALDVNGVRALLATNKQTAADIDQKVVPAEKHLTEAERLYTRSAAANGLTRLWKGLPKPEQQQAIVNSRRSDLVSIWRERSRVTEESKALQIRLADALRRIEAFRTTHRFSPDEVLAWCFAFDQQLRKSKDETELSERAAREARATLDFSLRGWVTALRVFGLAEDCDGGVGNMLAVLRNGYDKARTEVSNRSLDELRQTRDNVNERLRQIAGEIDTINDQLKRVAQIIISEARVIATTLTRAYLRDTIQSRRFDTVILNEASMAPIPALWVAASLADRNVIAVGDFKQLPPIVQSKHEVALKWLGQDVFDIAGMTSAHKRRCPPPHFVALKEQHLPRRSYSKRTRARARVSRGRQ
jgi:Cdc6-like AAA superfamily ATPase